MATARRVTTRGTAASERAKIKEARKSARAKPKTKSHANALTKPLARPHGNRLMFSTELLADIRRRYETTPETCESLEIDLGASRSTLRNIALRENWVRYVAPPRGLSRAAEIAAKAEALEAEALDAEAAAPPAALAWNMGQRIEELRGAVDEEIAAVRALRASLKGVPQSVDRAGRTARTLADLISTLERLHRLEIGTSQHNGHNTHDDIPADPDEFRLDLARRIAAFMESRPDDAAADGAASAAPDAAP